MFRGFAFCIKGAVVLFAMFTVLASPFLAQAQSPAETYEKQVKPNLSIPDFNLNFSNITVTSRTVQQDGKEVEVRTLDVPYLSQYIGAIYRYAVSIAGILAVVMMMVGGFQYMVARDTGLTKKGMDRIKHALIGLGLTLFAFLMLKTINPDLVNLNAFQVESVTAVLDYEPNENTLVDQTLADIDLTNQPTLDGSTEVPLYKQGAEPWRKVAYGQDSCISSTIHSSGCGPSSASMVVSFWTKKQITPDIIAAQFLAKKHRPCGSGTAGSAFTDQSIWSQYGLVGTAIYYEPGLKSKAPKGETKAQECARRRLEQADVDARRLKGIQAVKAQLQQGHPLVASVPGGSIFTSGGHYIVLAGCADTECTQVIVNDPGRSCYNFVSDPSVASKGCTTEAKASGTTRTTKVVPEQFIFGTFPVDFPSSTSPRKCAGQGYLKAAWALNPK
jgi:hypothetical protein